jgi:hypothetical protein
MGRLVAVPKWDGSGAVQKRVPDDVVSAWPVGTGGGTRFQLPGEWFVDHEPRVGRRHFRDHPYTLYESGAAPGGGAALRGSAESLDEMMHLWRKLTGRLREGDVKELFTTLRDAYRHAVLDALTKDPARIPPGRTREEEAEAWVNRVLKAVSEQDSRHWIAKSRNPQLARAAAEAGIKSSQDLQRIVREARAQGIGTWT